MKISEKTKENEMKNKAKRNFWITLALPPNNLIAV